MEFYDGRKGYRRRKKVIRNHLRGLFRETEGLSIKYKCILENKMYHRNFQKWFLLEIMVIVEKWKESLNIFKLTDSLSKKPDMIDYYMRIFEGTEKRYEEEKEEEAKIMAEKMNRNGGIIFVEGMEKKEEDKVYKISSECINITKD